MISRRSSASCLVCQSLSVTATLSASVTRSPSNAAIATTALRRTLGLSEPAPRIVSRPLSSPMAPSAAIAASLTSDSEWSVANLQINSRFSTPLAPRTPKAPSQPRMGRRRGAISKGRLWDMRRLAHRRASGHLGLDRSKLF